MGKKGIQREIYSNKCFLKKKVENQEGKHTVRKNKCNKTKETKENKV